jgi:lysozyme
MKKYLLVFMLPVFIMACNFTNSKSAAQKVANDSINTLPVYGIDISNYQGNEINFLNVAQDSLSFVICKATEGAYETDPDFKNNWNTIQQKGFTKGAYHFYHCKDDATAQVLHYLSVVDSFPKNDFSPIVDFEESSIDSGCVANDIQKNLLNFLTLLQQKTGRSPIVYTDNNTANLYLSDTAFSKYALWIAYYDNAAHPELPTVWKNNSWSIWQKSGTYQIGTITNDFDIFNGNQTQFKTFIQTH